jgi:eukaryotic-like serine/threonine-protein kinase
VEFAILGLLEVASDGRTLAIGPGKESALLAVLLLHANEPVSTDGLVEKLWESERPANAAKTVQVYVSRLRKQLESGRLLTTPGGYVLRVEDAELDAAQFERLAAEAREALERGSPREAAERLERALALWRGPPLADFRFDAFAQDEIRRLEDLHDAAVADRFDALLALGQAEALLPELEALTRARPLDERLQAQLILCLYRSGQQADALEAYARARVALVEELGVEPGRRLRELQQAILRQDPGLETVAAAPETDARRPFVGRERELAELEDRLEAALAGRGGLALLAGEPGIGKSRLADELTVRARARGAEVLVGRCWEAGGAPAYWPWVQALRTHVRETEPQVLREQLGPGAGEVAQILPELRELYPDLPEPAPAESDGARFRLFDAIAQLLRRASSSTPLVLGLDDLHAADEPSLLLLQFVAREAGSTPLLVVGAYRDVDPVPSASLTSVLAELSREPNVLRITLGGLDTDAVGELVERVASQLASVALTEALALRTEGNPLFVSETLRLLALEHDVTEPSAAGLAIPPSLRDVITRRLGHLSDDCAVLLPAAAVLGREFAVDTLAWMEGVGEDELLERLDAAVAARVITDVPGTDGLLRFAHVLIRDALYDGLTPAGRRRLHRRAVEALETLHAEGSGPHLAELALHALAGHELEKGVDYATRAGDRALALLAYEEAVRLYQAALAALRRLRTADDAARCELLLALGEARSRAGDGPGSKETFLDAAAIAEQLGLAGPLARAALGYGGRMLVVRAGRDERLVPLLEKALALLDSDQVELRIRLLSRLAGACRDEPSPLRRDALSREAVDLARDAGNDVALAFALEGRAAAILSPVTLDEVIGLGAELVAVGARIGDGERVGQGHSYLVMTRLALGDLEAAMEGIERQRSIARELAQPLQLWQIAVDEAMLELNAGRLEEAAAATERAFVIGARAIPELAVAATTFQRYLIADFRGDLEPVEPQMRSVVAEHPARRVFACALAHIHARQGRDAEAGLELDALAGDHLAQLPFDQEWLVAISLLAETAALLGRVDVAPGLYDALLPYAPLTAIDLPEGMRGSVSRYLGQLAALLGNWDAARSHFEEAVAANTRMGAAPWLALTRRDYAAMLRTSGDAALAGELDRAAREAFRDLGMTGYA